MKTPASTLLVSLSLFWSSIATAQIALDLVRPEDAFPGFAVIENVMKIVFKRAGYDLTITSMPQARTEFEANSGDRDGELARFQRYGDTHPHLIRVEPSYASSTVAMFARASSNVAIKDTSDLKKYTVGYTRSAQWAKDAIVELPKDQVEMANHSRSLFSMLEAGRFDVALEVKPQALTTIAKLKLASIVQVGPETTIPVFCYLHEKHRVHAPVIGATIKKMKESGELDRLLRAGAEKQLTQSKAPSS